MAECANCVRLRKRNRQLSNQLITARTKNKKSAKEMKALKKQCEKNISGMLICGHKSCIKGESF